MAVSWTKEQEQAIQTHEKDILVSAAAGSGKTAVLVERILQMVTNEEHPIDIDHLLVVTFTRAAAGEMKERILAALEARLQSDPENEHLQHQIFYIHNAQISTIDGFCAQVIRNYFHLIDLDPGYRTADEGELKLLKADVIQEVLEEAFEREGEEFEQFVRSYAPGKSDAALEERILELYELSRSHPWPEEWLASCKSVYEITEKEDLIKSSWFQTMLKEVSREIEDALQLIGTGIELSESDGGPYMYLDALQADREFLESLTDCADSYEKLYQKLLKVKWTRLSGKKDEDVSEDKRDRVKRIREIVKNIVKELQESWFYMSLSEVMETMENCRPAIRALVALTLAFGEAFTAKKRQKNILDFSDMEHLALKILINHSEDGDVRTEAARELSERYEEILIDEYQDSNYVQEMLLTSVSRHADNNNNIFMVGDVKQSIYRFRLANPELFMEKYHTYPLEGDGNTLRIDLHQNFRSRSEVLTFANYIFARTMRRSFGGVDYDERAALHAGAVYSDGENLGTEILLLAKNREELESIQLKGEEKELEARMIGQKIRELVESQQVYDNKLGEYRPLRYSDCVILLRSVSGYGEVFGKVLQSMGIPSYVTTRTGYFTALEVVTLLNYLHICDNPRQDIPFAAVLHAPIVGLSAQDMAKIRIQFPESSIYDACRSFCKNGTERTLMDKLSVFFEMLDQIRDMAGYTPIHELIQRILDMTGYGVYVRAMPAGEQRIANITMLVEKARDYEKTSYRGLFNFVRYIEQLQKYEVDFGEVNISGETENTVRIMTIHKSKGLEFPVVFLAGMGKKFNLRDLNAQVIIHPKLGLASDSIDPDRRLKTPTLFKQVVKRQLMRESLSEELRILYVALTRAREKLILTGVLDNMKSREEKSRIAAEREGLLIPEHLMSSARDYMAWILPALGENSPCSFRWVTPQELVFDETGRLLDKETQKERLLKWNSSEIWDEKLREQLAQRFEFKYPFIDQADIPIKVTVSELKGRVFEDEPTRRLQEEEYLPVIPKFMQKEGEVLVGAQRGTAYHKVFELLDYRRMDGREQVEQQLLEMKQDKKLTEGMYESIRISDLVHFGESSLGQRMKRAAQNGQLYREQPFTMYIPASELDAGCRDCDEVMVQGIIDAYFIEGDAFVLVDYKTDRVYQKEELVRRYSGQLSYYAQALERTTGRRVRERLIYSVSLGKVVECT